jgi:hypothetical protein
VPAPAEAGAAAGGRAKKRDAIKAVAAAAVARPEDAEREVAAAVRAAEQLLQQNRKRASSKSATAQRNAELGYELAAARSSLAAIECAYAPLKPLVQRQGDPVCAAAILRDVMVADAAIEDLLSGASSEDAAPDALPDGDTGGHGTPPPSDGRARAQRAEPRPQAECRQSRQRQGCSSSSSSRRRCRRSRRRRRRRRRIRARSPNMNSPNVPERHVLIAHDGQGAPRGGAARGEAHVGA